MDNVLTTDNILELWTEAELLYFPRSARINPCAEPDSKLEASIARHFAAVQEVYGKSKLELAKAARVAGLKLAHLMESGEDLSDSAVNELIKTQDVEFKKAVPRGIKRAEDITGPLVSLSDTEAEYDGSSVSAFLPGLFILYGAAESNKSHRLAKLHKYTKEHYPDVNSRYVIACEPDPRSVGSWKEAMSIMRFGFIGHDGETVVPDVIFIDSLKDLLYMPGDASGAGGISTSVILSLSSLSAQLMREGRTVVAVINPSQPKFVNDLYETLKSNVTGIFYFNPRPNANEKADHFSSGSAGKLLSSIRQWRDSYFERVESEELLTLLGLKGDILDANVDNLAKPTRKFSAVGSRTNSGRQLTKHIQKYLMRATPPNN